MIAADDYRALVREIAAHQAQLSSSSWWMDGADRLRLTTFGSLASVVLAVEGRMLDVSGHPRPFSRPHTPSSDRTAVETLIDLGEGFLLNVAIRATTGAPRRGQVYAILEVVRGLGATVQAVGVLWEGYVTATTPAGWPGTPASSSSEGPGVIRAVSGTNQGAGTDWTETVPTNARWRLLGLRTLLSTDATVANRFARFHVDDGTNVIWHSDPPAAQTASLTWAYAVGDGSPRLAVVDLAANWAMPRDLHLMGGFRLRAATVNLQAGDDWERPELLVEELIED